MGITRRDFGLGTTAVLGAAMIGPAIAAPIAKGDIYLICGFPTGTAGDTICRFFARKLQPILGATVTVVNIMEGAHQGYEGNLATKFVVEAQPDGRTIYLTAGGILVANQNLQHNPPFDVSKALQSFGTMTRVPNTLVVRADSPYKTLADLSAAMKVKGSDAKYGVPNGSVVRVIGALYRQQAGLQAAEIVKRESSEVFKDLDAGTIDYALSNNWYPVTQEKIGRVRILAMSLKERLHAAPQYPTFNEYGYPVDVDGWWAGYVPSATPRSIVNYLNAALGQVVASEECRQFFNGIICDPWTQTPDQSQALLERQLSAWHDYVEIANLEKEH